MAEINQATAGACWKRDDICFGTNRCVAGQSCEADYPSADKMACSCLPGQQCQPLKPGCWGYSPPTANNPTTDWTWTDARCPDPVISDNPAWLKARVRNLMLCTLDTMEEVDRLRSVLSEIRRDIEESADDVVWMRGGIETVCDRITAVLGDGHEQQL